MFQKSKIFMMIACTIALIIVSSVSVLAEFSLVDVYTGEESPSNYAVHSFVIFADNNAVVTNDIYGTAFVFGNTVSVKSKIDGDLFIFGNKIDFSGEVTGNVYCFGNDVNLMGEIQKDAVILGNIVAFASQNKIARDVLVFGNDLNFDGKIIRNAHISCVTTQISGEVDSDVRVSAKNISVSETAIINGTLFYESQNEINIPDAAKISKVNYTPENTAPAKTNVIFDAALKMLTSVFGAFLICLFVAFFAPIFGKKTAYSLSKKPLRTLLTGLITIIAIPIISVILMITVVGIKIGISFGLLYGIAIYLSFGIVAYAFASVLAEKLRWKTILRNVWYALAVSLIMKLLTMIPFIGGFVMFAIILLGLGLIFSFVFRNDNIETAVNV